MANIKYIRVSTKEQNTARQEKETNDFDKIFIDKASGKNTHRPGLEEMLSYIREGDTVTVDSYSRLARNTRDLLDIADQLNKKGVHLVSIKEGINTGTPQGKLIMTIFAGLAEFEREQLLQRQAEGIAIAKEKGVYKGRQRIAINDKAFEKQYQTWKAGIQTAVQTAKNLNLSMSTFYRRVKEYEEK